ncbi:FAD-dependent 5-carboxymethylaminomethyl-2-thiouridine(34) oxidoreductase MnmC [Brevundimonas variabilis]|uniref:tRNA 5-methylaminomethyl-2-thiouridine biosynthesis bifunctional protein MnmC n=1 Tax=Brevundimonas variabilis TaxID=74312 RepID=A0A7W9FHC4_9CAUL|nr:FAD-dependent 5-carboxymethylaminomethyl-2-thiouridine(34) oxidoreductase MnmC [Brevundimonas variabilis]MBB5747299.1 tRNA 5-methylaminomethyl-2-thiouridine biosynthesis bifunctional protein [Brevundimonas variabilis]
MSEAAPSPADRSPQLVWADDGSPRSGRFDDVYFSTDDGLAESRAVFLAGCSLPEAWAGRKHFTVAELGFGTGLNIIALLDLWTRSGPSGGHLHIVSVEGFPVSREEAARALANWPEVASVARHLLDAWPASQPGFHRVDLPDLNATLDLMVGDAADVLGRWSGQADAWFLDGFSPATNPGMWSQTVLDAIAARSAPGARIATFTVAGAVRRGLNERGFVVEKRPGHGRKRERLEACLPGSKPASAPSKRVAVIGGGIAGAALCRALTAAGQTPLLVEREAPGAAASGFPAALVTPRLDAGDSVIAGLHAQALERAGDLYRQIPEAVTAESVLQLAPAPRDPARFAKIATQTLWQQDAMVPFGPDEASERLGEPVDASGLLMHAAFAIQPRPILEAWLEGVEKVRCDIARIEPAVSGWILRDAGGQAVVEVDAVVIASGWGTAALLPSLPLAPVRGQADWVYGIAPMATAWGGYVAPSPTGFLYGATHDRDDVGTDVRPEDSLRNRATLSARLPELAKGLTGSEGQARAAIRATTPDRLPICGPVEDRPGLWVLSGLGSRGFCLAPLLAEHLAAMIAGTPSPLPTDYADRLRPSRFPARPT